MKRGSCTHKESQDAIRNVYAPEKLPIWFLIVIIIHFLIQLQKWDMFGATPIKDSMKPMLQPLSMLGLQAFIIDLGSMQKIFKVHLTAMRLEYFRGPIFIIRQGFCKCFF